jgi:signal transduction histidine kinase
MLQQQLASCIKEALSNAIRHGGASQVTLSFKNNLLIIDDNGSGIVNKVELGFGLSNLLKRLAPFGGKFKLGSREPTGCRLEISLESGIAL